MCVCHRTGDGEAPLAWAHSAHEADDGDFASYEAEQLAAARILLAAGERTAAARMLERLAPRLRSARHFYELIEALLLHAACTQRDSAESAARELMEAIRIAAPERIVLPFSREGELLRGLCERTPFLAMASADIDWERIGSFLELLGVEAKPAASVAREAVVQAAELTGREREVLRLLRNGMSDQEIAGALSISRHTVHVHCRNLYKKLGVSGRREAVEMVDAAPNRA